MCVVSFHFVLHVLFFWVGARDGTLSLARKIYNLSFLAVCGYVTFGMRGVVLVMDESDSALHRAPTWSGNWWWPHSATW